MEEHSMRIRKNQKGFSLIELIIYMSIVAIATVVFTNFLVDVTRNAAKSRVTKDVQQNARLAMQWMTREIRRASSIMPSGSTLTLNSGTFTVNASNQLDYSGTPITSADVRVTTLTFTPIGTSGVGIVLTVEQGNPSAQPAERDRFTLTSGATSRILAY